MNYNSFIVKKSIIHRMNPSLKFLMTCFVIAMIFIPFGYFFQIILLVFCLALYFLAKLPMKKLWNIIQSIIFMAIILLIINWITYKGPGVVFDFYSHAKIFSKPTFLNLNNYHTTLIDGKWFLQGDMYGGKWLENNIFYPLSSSISKTFINHNGFFKLWEINGNGEAIIDGISYGNSDKLFSNLVKYISENSNDYSLVGKLKYYSEYVNINGNKFLFAYFYSAPWYGYSSKAISLMLYVSIKIFLMILIVTILTSTTSSIQLTCALEDILNPLRFLRLPIAEWSTTIALGLRFIPSLLDESNRILKAQASRGLDFKNGNIKDKVFSLTSLVVPLFSIAFKKASELANAMEARGYNPRYLRTRYRDYDIKLVDWFMFALSCLLFGILITLVTIAGKPIFISSFPIYEALAMF